MSTPYIQILLRRTAVAFAALLGFAISNPVLAQSNSLKKSTGETICTYSQMAVTPSGGIVVTCDTGGGTVDPPPPPPGGNFTITGSSTLGVGAGAVVSINRTGGTAGEALVAYTISGGCLPAAGTTWFPNNGATTGLVSISAPNAAGSCTVTLTGVTGAGTIVSPSQLTIAVGSTQQQPPPPNGCPTPPGDVLDYNVKLSGADILRMSSGRIASSPLPGVKDNGGTTNSGQIVFGESTVAPRSATVEISINKCRGVIDQNAGFCYTSVSSSAFMKISWIEKAVWGANTDSIANAYKLCRAYQTEGPYYINVRYTFGQGSCLWGEGTCGFVNQWNYESF